MSHLSNISHVNSDSHDACFEPQMAAVKKGAITQVAKISREAEKARKETEKALKEKEKAEKELERQSKAAKKHQKALQKKVGDVSILSSLKHF